MGRTAVAAAAAPPLIGALPPVLGRGGTCSGLLLDCRDDLVSNAPIELEDFLRDGGVVFS